MPDNHGKHDGITVTLVVIGLLTLLGVGGWAVIGTYLEVRAGKQVSQQRMLKVQRQIEERRASASPNE